MNTLTKLLATALCALWLGGCACGGDDDDDCHAGQDAGLADAGVPDAEAQDSGTADCPAFGQVPVPEECNAFDDDCDGEIDEGACDDPCNDL
jgi:hypothetical protein